VSIQVTNTRMKDFLQTSKIDSHIIEDNSKCQKQKSMEEQKKSMKEENVKDCFSNFGANNNHYPKEGIQDAYHHYSNSKDNNLLSRMSDSQCKLCYMEFPSSNELEFHTKNVHTDDFDALQLKYFTMKDLKYACEICPLKFLTENILSNHIIINHSEDEATKDNGISMHENCKQMKRIYHKSITSKPKRKVNLACEVNLQRLVLTSTDLSELLVPNISKPRRRKNRCLKCSACMEKNCRKCFHCKDMKKYGGKGKLKQACLERSKCLMLL